MLFCAHRTEHFQLGAESINAPPITSGAEPFRVSEPTLQFDFSIGQGFGNRGEFAERDDDAFTDFAGRIAVRLGQIVVRAAVRQLAPYKHVSTKSGVDSRLANFRSRSAQISAHDFAAGGLAGSLLRRASIL